jgi:hypothetical protein
MSHSAIEDLTVGNIKRMWKNVNDMDYARANDLLMQIKCQDGSHTMPPSTTSDETKPTTTTVDNRLTHKSDSVQAQGVVISGVQAAIPPKPQQQPAEEVQQVDVSSNKT